MNKELETIIENEFDCLINDLGCLMGDEWKAESIKKVVNQAFVLGGVVKSFYCECDYPFIRTNGTGGEYCANCNMDLEQ